MNIIHKILRKKIRDFIKIHSYETIYNLIDEINAKTYVEVGVWKGNTFEQIIQHPNLTKAIAIDPYKIYDENGKSEFKKRLNQKKFDSVYEEVQKKFKKNKKVEIIRKNSIDASNEFSNESFDLIFIDANHSYEFVKKDIEIWLPKLKKGGILAGHDYSLRFFGVIKAVNETLKEENIEVCKHGTSVWWYKKI